jgi:solute:Na+ symporter, SSS family
MVRAALWFFFVGAFGEAPRKELFAYLGSTPTLDGYIDPAEWADAYTVKGIGQWDPEFLPVPRAAPVDLDLTLWVKHDAKRLYFGFRVEDDVLYGYQTPSWLPSGNPSANNLTQEGWPWFGDEMELLLNPGNLSGYSNTTVPGNASAWQMVCNLHKSRLGGIGVGGLLEGEPRSSLSAWDTYQQWILTGCVLLVSNVER